MPAATLGSLHQLFLHELRDVYDAEKQLLKALPKMADAATDSELRKGFQDHLQQTEEHVARIEQAFEMLGEKAQGIHCKGMAGIVAEGDEVLKDKKSAEPSVCDAALIAAAQAVEHYEMARYGTLCEWAQEMGHDDVADLLHRTLEEERQTDEKLTALAQNTVNPDALAANPEMKKAEVGVG